MKITRIKTNGYRGAPSGGEYLPPGEYEVGDALDVANRMVTPKLARYLVDTEQATVVDAEDDAPEPPTGEVVTKQVNVADGKVQQRRVTRRRSKRTSTK